MLICFINKMNILSRKKNIETDNLNGGDAQSVR